MVPGDTEHTFSGPIHALEDFDCIEKPRYTPEELHIMFFNVPQQPMVDRALKGLGEIALQAEVHRFRRMSVLVQQYKEDLHKIETMLYKAGAKQAESIRRLQNANILERLEMEDARLVAEGETDLFTELMERGRST